MHIMLGYSYAKKQSLQCAASAEGTAAAVS
jgi:hypothetical protein